MATKLRNFIDNHKIKKTQIEIAEGIGHTQSYLNDILNGKKNLTDEILKKVLTMVYDERHSDADLIIKKWRIEERLEGLSDDELLAVFKDIKENIKNKK